MTLNNIVVSFKRKGQTRERCSVDVPIFSTRPENVAVSVDRTQAHESRATVDLGDCLGEA